MPVRTSCPHCEVAITFLNPQAGERLTCPRCSGVWVHGAPADRTGGSGHSQTVSPEPTYKVACPKCSAVTKLPLAAGGHVMTCKRCAAQVVLPDATAVRKPVTVSEVEVACPKCSRCFSVHTSAEFEWTECPGCGVVSIARPKTATRAQPLPPPLPASAPVTGSQPATAGAPLWNQKQSPNSGQSRGISRWVGVLVVLACLTVAVLIGVSLRDAGQAKSWTSAERGEDRATRDPRSTTGRGEDKVTTSSPSTTGRIEEKALTGRDLITFLKEQGAVAIHTPYPERDLRGLAPKGWLLITRVPGREGAGISLLEFEAEIDAQVLGGVGCTLGRCRIVKLSEELMLAYQFVIGKLLTRAADARFAFSDATKARLREEFENASEALRR